MKKFLSFALVFVLSMQVSVSAQSSFDLRYEEAKNYYYQREYDKAIVELNNALKNSKPTKEQKSKANQLLHQCKQENEAAKKLYVHKKNFDNLSFHSSVDSTYIEVPSQKPWHIESSPSWVNPVVSGDMIYFNIAENPEHEPRDEEMEITLDNTSTTYIRFKQNARPIIPKTLNIHSEPYIVQLLVDYAQYSSPANLQLNPGTHQIKASRNQFVTLDTTITIVDDLNYEDIDFSIKLKRQFATLTVNIVSGIGKNDIIQSPVLTIDDKVVDLHPSILNDYNDFKPIEFYTLYSNGSIPIVSGYHVIKVTAPGYEDCEYICRNIENNEDYPITMTLTPKTGYLKVTDLCDANGADIFIDKVLLKDIKVPCDSLPIPIGKHVVTFRKEGMISTSPTYPIEIYEHETSTVEVSMVGCDVYTFGGSLPPYATIVLDSVEIGRTPLSTIITKGMHHVEIRKTGHLTIDDFFTVEGKNDSVLYDKEMPETETFKIRADENHLHIFISQKGKSICSKANTPTDIELPISKDFYKIVLKRDRKNKTRTAYRGYFKFNKPEKNSLYIQSWSSYILQIFEGQYYINPTPNVVYGKNFKHLGDASLVKLQLVPGLSSSLLKGKIFLATNNEEELHLDNDVVVSGDKHKVLPAFSCILINEEFRLGGALFSYMDANLLATYTWYPKMNLFLPLSHVSGHEVFGGLEVSTRFPVATLTFKLGYEALIKGEANIYSSEIASGYNPKTKDCFVSTPMNIGQFMVGVSLSLAGMRSKGNNILRVF